MTQEQSTTIKKKTSGKRHLPTDIERVHRILVDRAGAHPHVIAGQICGVLGRIVRDRTRAQIARGKYACPYCGKPLVTKSGQVNHVWFKHPEARGG